jgi:hypothetical protein
MFKSRDRVKYIGQSDSFHKVGKIYTVFHKKFTVDNVLLINTMEHPHRWRFAELFELYTGKQKAKKYTNIKPYFVRQDKSSNKVLVFDIDTRKVVCEAEDVGLFYGKKGRLGKLHGFIGYVQETITPDFLTQYNRQLDYEYRRRFTKEPSIYDGCEYSIVYSDGVCNLDGLKVNDKLSGIKGLTYTYSDILLRLYNES